MKGNLLNSNYYGSGMTSLFDFIIEWNFSGMSVWQIMISWIQIIYYGCGSILGFVARYVNVACRKSTITNFNTFSMFETYISYNTYVAYV